MFCKWCGGKIQLTDSTCKACGRETPAMSDCGGLYNLKYEAPLAGRETYPNPGQPDPQLGRRLAGMERKLEDAQANGRRQQKIVLIGAAGLLLIFAFLLGLCLTQQRNLAMLGGQIEMLEAQVEELKPNESDGLWYGDEIFHWQTVEYNGQQMVLNLGQHEGEENSHFCTQCAYTISQCTDDDNNCECDVCKAEMHRFSDQLSADEHNHYYEAICGHAIGHRDTSPHQFDEQYKCVECGYQHEHTYANEWNYDETQHWHEATCGHEVQDEPEDHADNMLDHKCDTCGKELSQCIDEDENCICDICGENVHDLDEQGKCKKCGHQEETPSDPEQ